MIRSNRLDEFVIFTRGEDADLGALFCCDEDRLCVSHSITTGATTIKRSIKNPIVISNISVRQPIVCFSVIFFHLCCFVYILNCSMYI